jgi:hypothetical protein
MENINNLNELFDEITDSDTFDFATSVRSGNGVMSFSIIKSDVNGKRITLSKTLVSALELSEKSNEQGYVTIYIMPLTAKGLILISSKQMHPQAKAFSVRGGATKVAYNSKLVQELARIFNLDYSDCVSRSFRDITFVEGANPPIAKIRLAVSTASVKESSEEE